MRKLSLLEVFLIEIVLYFLLWNIDDYLASMLSLIFGFIFLALLIISILVELVERSKVPRSYFTFMVISILAPIVAGIIMIVAKGGVDWLQ